MVVRRFYLFCCHSEVTCKFVRMMSLTGRLSVNDIIWFFSFCDICGADCWLVV